MRLGELINLLKRQRQDAWVYIDGPARITPGALDSYRGFYEDLAIGLNFDGLAPTVADFVKELEAAVGQVFHGWKGGEFRMSRETFVWFGNRGETTGYGPSGIKNDDDDSPYVTLTYAEVERW